MMTEVVSKKWGNSYGIRIPHQVMKDLEIQEDSKMTLCVMENKLLIEKKQSLQDLCAAINADNLNTQNEWIDQSKGKEW